MKATRGIMATSAGLIARCFGRALPVCEHREDQSRENGEQSSHVEYDMGSSARPLMAVVNRGNSVHRNYKRAWGFMLGLSMMMGAVSTTADAVTLPGTVITNVAEANYQVSGSPRSGPSNIVTNTVVTPNSATITAIFTPHIVNDGNTTVAAVQGCNNGINPISNGILRLTPPVGSIMTVPAIDPYGNYTALQPSPTAGEWIITLTGARNPLAVGACVDVPSTVMIPVGTPAGLLAMPVSLTGDSLPPVIGVATLEVQNSRTPAVITFWAQPPAGGPLMEVEAYRTGQDVYIQVQDLDQNIDSTVLEQITVTLTDSLTGDSESLIFSETGLDTGIFILMLPSTTAAAVPNNGIISMIPRSKLTANYVDPVDGSDVTEDAALIDPFGIVFDSTSGLPLNGATVALINVATGLPAAVFGDDGVSTYPSTLVSGGPPVTDSSGFVYTFAAGEYRFPLMAAGTYRMDITPPTGYDGPSTVSTATLQTLPGAPFSIVTGSRGENFVLLPGPPLNIDIPLDRKSAGLFVQKRVLAQRAAMGDLAPYTITVENPAPLPLGATVNGVTVQDTLPVGFRYLAGTAKLDGAPFADPGISSNGRIVTFTVGDLAPQSLRTITYVTELTANVIPGPATNVVIASGLIVGAPVISNIAKATMEVIEDLFMSKSTIAGVVFVDSGLPGEGLMAANSAAVFSDGGSISDADGSVKVAASLADNGIHDEGEQGIAGVRIFMEDGTFTVTDENGKFHFEGVTPGTHVLQMDMTTLSEEYEAVPLANTRFSGRAYSQFVEVRGGGLWRSNFRVLRRPPPDTPVKVEHILAKEGNDVWATVNISYGEEVDLTSLTGIYLPPAGWQVVAGSASVDGVPTEPARSLTGLNWKLGTEKREYTIRMQLEGGGEGGDKQAVAYARFASSGTPKGRTGMAINALSDIMHVEDAALHQQLYLNFANRKALVTKDIAGQLDAVIESLSGLDVSRIELIGHTNSIRIAPENRHEFANNQVLSEARARSVADYMQAKLKLTDDQVTASGKGKWSPLASNSTSDGLRINRRTELKVWGSVRHDLQTLINDRLSTADGEAKGSWSVKKERDVDKRATERLSPSDVTAWLAKATPGTKWLFPGKKDLPAIPASYVLVQHTAEQKVTLTVNGEAVNSLMFDGSQKSADGSVVISSWRNVHLKEGKNIFVATVLDADGGEVSRIEETVHYASPPVSATWVREKSDAVADGMAEPVIAIRLLDSSGQPARAGVLGDVRIAPPHRSADEPLVNDIVLTKFSPKYRVSEDGIAYIRLKPTARTGEVTLTFDFQNGPQEVTAWIKPAARDWIMVGLGSGTVGYNRLKGAIQPITKQDENDKFYRDGRLAFYAKGRVKGDFLLTAAYDTAKSRGQVGNSVYQVIDPNNYYTLYGDTTEQQYDASSQSKLYLKLERETFYALFGDFNTGMTLTELSRYSRSMNGLKSEYRGDMLSYTAFASQTSQTLVRDELRGDGTSGLYRLTRQDIVANSEQVFIETRDRFKSEVIIESRKLVSHVDYSIDYPAGTLFFKQPVLSKDADLNPIYIVIEYESDDQDDQFVNFGGRGSVKPVKGVELGVSYVQQGQLGRDATLAGVDARYKLNNQTEVKAEYAQSANANISKATAWKAEVSHVSERLRGQAYLRQLDGDFGIGQTLGSEDATRKMGALADAKLTDDLLLRGEAYRQEGLLTGSKRDLAQAEVRYNLGQSSLRTGLRYANDVDGAGTARSSKQLTLGATTNINERLSARVDREQSLGGGENSVDFPTRTSLGADYKITQDTTLSATHEWTQGAQQSSETSRLGVRSQPWDGAQLSTSYEQQLGEGGMRSFANVGLLQQLQMTDELSFQIGFDRSKTLRYPGATPLNLNAPLASGGGSDFTAYSLGMTYRPDAWIWNNRLEYRLSSIDKRWNIFTGVQGDIFDWLTSAFNFQWNQANMLIGSSSVQGSSSLSFAWRPDYDGLMLLDRFELAYDSQSSATNNQTTWRYINNLAANWQATPEWQLALYYGAKLTRDRIDNTFFTGFTDAIGVQGIYDINESWDVSVQGGLLHTWRTGQLKPSGGLSVGHRLAENLWVSLGYNFVGFYDKDFIASEFTRQGPFLRARFKFDQDSLSEMLKAIQ